MKTKTELYLAKIAGEDIYLPTPDTRTEFYLAKLAGMNVSLPEPVTERDALLYQIANEGLNVGGGGGEYIVPEGSILITSNGIVDVREYAEAEVNIPQTLTNLYEFELGWQGSMDLPSNLADQDGNFFYIHGGLNKKGEHQITEKPFNLNNMTYTAYALMSDNGSSGTSQKNNYANILFYLRPVPAVEELIGTWMIDLKDVYKNNLDWSNPSYKLETQCRTIYSEPATLTIDGQLYLIIRVALKQIPVTYPKKYYIRWHMGR